MFPECNPQCICVLHVHVLEVGEARYLFKILFVKGLNPSAIPFHYFHIVKYSFQSTELFIEFKGTVSWYKPEQFLK